MEDGFQPSRLRKSKGKSRRAAAQPYKDEVGVMDETEMKEAETLVLQPIDLEELMATEEETQQEQQQQTFVPIGPDVITAAGKGGLPRQKMGPSLRRIHVAGNRMTPLKTNWTQLIEPLVLHMKLQVRFNTHRRCVELRPAPTNNIAASLEKGGEYIKAFLLGFAMKDIIALLKLDDIYLQSFQVTDVKRLPNDHLSRAIGRIAGKDGKTRFAIENSTRTRIVIADKNIHLLGSATNIMLARDSICSLIMGSPPGKVYNHLRVVSRRMKERG